MSLLNCIWSSFVTQAQLDELNIVCTKKEEDEAAE